MTKISIIMPVYNGEEFLEKSVESVSRQTINDIELICVDDGSTDNSLKILQKLQEKYDFIKILTQENQGSGKARNYGIDEAKGEYIGFIDADDIFVDEDALEKMYNVAIENNANMAAGNLKELLSDGRLIYNSNYTYDNYYEFKETEKIHPKEYGVPWAFYKNIYKKSFLDENNIRFRDLIRGQDPVFMAEVLVNLDEIYGVPVVLYAYLFPVKGKVYIKLNSPKKKLHYITHYKMTFDIFDENGFENLSHKYKPKFLRYAKEVAYEQDFEAFEMIMDVFGKDIDSYFDDFEVRYGFFKVSYILNKLNQIATEEYFIKAKKEISRFRVWKNKHFTADQYRTLLLIFSSETFDEYKEGWPQIHIVSLKEKKILLKEEKAELKAKIKKNKKKNNSLKKFNKSLFNSSSWKLTKYLRRN